MAQTAIGLVRDMIQPLYIIGFLFSTSVFSNTMYDHCFKEAGERYGIDPLLLKAIALQESGLNHAAVSHVGDIGLMQINPYWLEKLLDFGIDESMLEDPCLNTNVGAWILASNFQQFGRNWRSVGIYHAGTSSQQTVIQRAIQYTYKIQSHYNTLSSP